MAFWRAAYRGRLESLEILAEAKLWELRDTHPASGGQAFTRLLINKPENNDGHFLPWAQGHAP
jgi:hypothetical protein